MTLPAEDLLREALKLPRPDRERIAAALVASCDDVQDPQIEAAWRGEVERRISEGLRTDWAGSRDWAEVRAELIEAYAKPR